MMIDKIGIVIPCYNEEKTIGKVIKMIPQNMAKETIILVVDDGSTDKTIENAKNTGATEIISHGTNCGLGAAIRTGFIVADFIYNCDIVIKTDGDFQYDPRDMPKLIEPIKYGKYDAVFGSRYHGSGIRTPLHKKIGNIFFGLLLRLLLHVKLDCQTGMKAFSKNYLKEFEILYDYNATQEIIMDVVMKKFKWTQVPIRHYKRDHGKSFISLKYLWIVTSHIIKGYLWRRKELAINNCSNI